MPITADKAKNLMRHHPTLFDVSKLSDTYYRFYEVMMGYWLTNGNTSYSSQDYITFSRLLGGSLDKTYKSSIPNFSG